MASNQMYRTERRRYRDTWIEAEFGLHKIGQQEPYMSLSGVEFSHPTSRHDRYWVSCGQIRDLALAAFPELAPLAPWHLCTDGAPMHYMANARFWWEGYHNVRQRTNDGRESTEQIVAHFKSTIAAGVLPNENVAPDFGGGLIRCDWPHVRSVLEARESRMRRRFASIVAILPELAAATNAKPL